MTGPCTICEGETTHRPHPKQELAETGFTEHCASCGTWQIPHTPGPWEGMDADELQEAYRFAGMPRNWSELWRQDAEERKRRRDR